jgi:hypothetical protein
MSASSTNDSVAECYEERQIIKKSVRSTNPAHTDTIITTTTLDQGISLDTNIGKDAEYIQQGERGSSQARRCGRTAFHETWFE